MDKRKMKKNLILGTILVPFLYLFFGAMGCGTQNGNVTTNVVTLASGQGGPFGIAVDGTSVYWVNFGDGGVMKASLGGGTPVTLASGQGAPVSIVVDGTNAYWTSTTDGTAMKVPLGGGPPVAVA